VYDSVVELGWAHILNIEAQAAVNCYMMQSMIKW